MEEEKGNPGLIGPRALRDDYERDVFTVPTKVEFVTMLMVCKLFRNDGVITKIISRRW
jgi:hypothetical protein